MLQLWGVGSDERKGDRIAYWGFAWSEASLPPFLQGNIIPHPPTTEPGDYFLTPPFCRSHQKYFYRFLVNTLLEALYLGIQPWLSRWIVSSCFLVELQCWHRAYWLCWWSRWSCSYCSAHFILLQETQSVIEGCDLSWAVPCLGALAQGMHI